MSARFPLRDRHLASHRLFCPSRGMSAVFTMQDRHLASHRLFWPTDPKSAQVTKEVRALHPEGLLRQIPRQSVQRRRHRQRIHRLALLRLTRTLLHLPAHRVIRVQRRPRRRASSLALRLTVRLGAHPLPRSEPRVRLEPPTTDRAGPLSDPHGPACARPPSGGPARLVPRTAATPPARRPTGPRAMRPLRDPVARHPPHRAAPRAAGWTISGEQGWVIFREC